MKRLMFTLSLPLVLAACGGVEQEPLPVDRAPVVNPASATLESGFFIENAQFRDLNYTGPVICDDRVTEMALSFTHQGSIQSVEVLLEGSQGARNTNLTNVQVIDENDTDNRIAIAFEANANAVPLSIFGKSISPQAIVVNPKPVVNPNIIGATRLVLVAVSPTGLRSEPIVTNYVPVVDNCPQG